MKDISPGQSEIKLLKTSDKEKVWQTGSTQPPRLLHEETLDASPQARAKAGGLPSSLLFGTGWKPG